MERDRFDRWCAQYGPLPVDDPMLTSFCAQRRITPADLERVGARWQGPSTIAFYYAEGIKTRDLSRLAEPGGGRAAEPGSQFTRLRVLRSLEAGDDPAGVILAEGETDAARLLGLYPDHDVAVLPAGAKPPTDVTRGQVRDYRVVRVALDNDRAGDAAADAWVADVPRAVRMRPPANDWCSSDEPPGGWASLLEVPRATVFTVREVIAADLGSVADNNWFADGVLPVGGFQMIHAAPKSLKSFLILEEARALASGTPFAGVYAFTRPHPARVLVYQYEIPPKYFQLRLMAVASAIADPDERDAVLDNLVVKDIANGARPYLKIGPGLLDAVRADVEESDADVVIFDPFQKMTGAASMNDAHELEPLFDAVDRLRADDAITVIGLHHNRKADAYNPDPLSMTGTQRFSADPDAIVSMWAPRGTNLERESDSKTRNFGFTLRNGVATASSITVARGLDDPDLVRVTFGPAISTADDAPDTDAPARPDIF